VNALAAVVLVVDVALVVVELDVVGLVAVVSAPVVGGVEPEEPEPRVTK
jgi:Na+/H+ antiporter NhaB